MSYLTGFAGEYDGKDRLKLIQEVLRGLGSPVATPETDTTADYSRYPKQDIIDKLNDAQVEFVRKTACLKTFAIVETVANQKQYRLPRSCMKITDARYYKSLTSYEQLRAVPDRSQMKRISSGWATVTGGTPQYILPGLAMGNVRSFEVYPKPTTAGTTYSGTTMGIVTSVTDLTFTGSITGQHKTGFSNSAFLVDSAGRDMETLGARVGMMIFNSTDGSSGQITAIGDQAATNDKISVTLAGGTDNDFDTSDSFEISVAEYGVVIRADGTEEYLFSSEYGELSDITPLANNLLLEFIKRPLKLSADNQYPEIFPEYHTALVDYAIWKLGGTEYDGVVQEKRSVQAGASWGEALNNQGSFGEKTIEPDNEIEDTEFAEFGY